MSAPTASDLLRLLADHLPTQDPADFVAAVAWRLDQRAAAAADREARLVVDLARATGQPVAVIRLAHGLDQPLFPSAPDPEAPHRDR
jgi:hypothetical protein